MSKPLPTERPSKYQVILWWHNISRWHWFLFRRLQKKETCMACIYEWFLCIGPVEIRKWAPRWTRTHNCGSCGQEL